jgi:hypothetical protein
MSMSELSDTVTPEPSTTEARIADTKRRATHFTFGVLQFVLEESIFAGAEAFERAKTEMHLFSEFATKIAGAHSVKDIGTMCAECSKHQIDFVRRDSDRLFRHGEHMIEAAAKLFTAYPLS